MVFMDNFSLLDNPKTTGVMDTTWLKAKYETIGNPAVRVQTVNGRNMLRLNGRTATLAAPWLVMKPIESTFGPKVVGLQIVPPVAAANAYASFGLISKIDETTIGNIFNFKSGPSALQLQYRDALDVAQSVTITVPTIPYFFDVYFDKVSNGSEYSRLTISINNTPVFHSTAGFCNFGSDLKFVLAGTLLAVETVGSPFFSEQNVATNIGSSFEYSITDLYITDGQRFGKPIIETVGLTAVESTLTAGLPLINVLSGVPNYDQFASGSGLTDITFGDVEGEIAQFSALVQKNSPNEDVVEVGIDGQTVVGELSGNGEYVSISTDGNVAANGTIVI